MGSKKVAPKRGTYVSRSTYQKVVEENRRLLADIYAMCKGKGVEVIKVKVKWIEKFDKEADQRKFIREVVRQYIKNNPDDPAVKVVKSLSDKVSG